MKISEICSLYGIVQLNNFPYDIDFNVNKISIVVAYGDIYWIEEDDFVVIIPKFIDFDEVDSIIKSLALKKVLGYIIVTGKTVPRSTIDTAEKLNKPLFYYKSKRDLTNIFKIISGLVDTDEVSEFFLSQLKFNLINTMNTKHYNEKNVIRLISIFLNRECYLLSSTFNIINYGKHNAPSDIPLIEWAEVVSKTTRNLSYKLSPIQLNYKDKDYLAFPLKSEMNILGYFCIESSNQDNWRLDRSFVYEMLPFFLICASQNTTSKLIKIKTFEDFLKSILYRFNENTEEIKKESLKYDLDYYKDRFVWIIDFEALKKDVDIEETEQINDILKYIVELSRKFFYKNIFIIEKTKVISIQEKEDVLDEVHLAKYRRVLNELEYNYPEFRFYFGFSRAYKKIDELSYGYEEALFSISIGKKIFHGTKNILNYNDLIIYHFLYDQKENNIVKRLYLNIVEPIKKHDKEKHDELLDTVTSLIENDFNYKSTSEAMYIHRNTLYQRISKIESVIKMDLKSPETKLLLQLGIKYNNVIEILDSKPIV